ncbi:hypothetical protein ACFWY9_35170 [Amycolatopsis sp. NPDC059027]|uniref:hypothetical protein n=1 Tax=Amycolatopsis sp. NPDC059027 TaxID=3346709 RepID=UPI003671E9B9
MIRRTFASIAALAVTVATLTACSSHVGGQASPSASGPATTRSTPTTTDDPSNPFAGMNQCTMLDQLLAGQGFQPATPSLGDPKRACSANKPITDTEPAIVAGLGLYPGQKINENLQNPSQAKPGKINDSGRPVVMEPEPLHSRGQCQINLQVATNSHANVGMTSGTDTERACKLVQGLAEKVDPLLPKA